MYYWYILLTTFFKYYYEYATMSIILIGIHFNTNKSK